MITFLTRSVNDFHQIKAWKLRKTYIESKRIALDVLLCDIDCVYMNEITCLCRMAVLLVVIMMAARSESFQQSTVAKHQQSIQTTLFFKLLFRVEKSIRTGVLEWRKELGRIELAWRTLVFDILRRGLHCVHVDFDFEAHINITYGHTIRECDHSILACCQKFLHGYNLGLQHLHPVA